MTAARRASAARASVLPGFDPGPDIMATIALTCPTDPAAILAEVERGLYRALVKRGETWHLRTCRNSHVNSQPFECSDPCLNTQIGLAWAGIWRARRVAREGARAIG